MKRFFLTCMFAAGFFVLWSQSEIVWSNRLLLDTPQLHKIEKGEYLSLIAKRYYGDPARWRELALINRAPVPDHVEVGEEILVPAANKVAEISRARTLTQVNAMVNEQERDAVRSPSTPVTQAPPAVPQPTSEIPQGNGLSEPSPQSAPVLEEPTPPSQENGFPWLWVGIGVVVAAIIGFVISRRRNPEEQVVTVNVDKKANGGVEEFRSRRQYGSPSTTRVSEKTEVEEVNA